MSEDYTPAQRLHLISQHHHHVLGGKCAYCCGERLHAGCEKCRDKDK